MEKLIISSSYQNLKRFLEKNKHSRYYYITITNEFDDIEHLLNEKKCKKIDIDKFKSKIYPDFQKDYIEFIGNLSREYNSIYWWANSISSKNIFISNFYLTIYYYCLIINILGKQDFENVIFICDDDDLNNGIKRYCRGNNIYCKILDLRKNLNLLKYIESNIYFLGNVLYFVFNGWRKKYIASRKLKRRIKSELKKDKEYYLFRTWLDKRSFPSHKEYSDVYFGKLLQYILDKREDIIILGGIPNNYLYKKMASTVSDYKDILIVLQDYYVKYIDYINVIILSYIHKNKIKKPLFLKDVDVKYLINTQLKKDHKYEVITNLIYFFSIKRLLRKIKIHTFIFPFENQSWEKITVLALRKYSPTTKIIGYQHTRVMKALLNYFPGKAEKNIIPIPDKIITVGKEPKRILEKYGNYKEDIVKEGCALRYEYLFRTNIIERSKKYKILVALPLSIDESVKIINFLYKSLHKETKYTIIFRSHPLLPFEKIKERLKIVLSKNFQASKNTSMKEDLKNSDILIYTLTTVCIEALMIGIPVIHIDLGEPINADPLFECNHLKWTSRHEKELLKAINEIYSLSNEEFKKQQRLARKYIESYFLPVTDDRMEEFIKV